MAIPDFQSIMRPLLEHLADGKVHGNRETNDFLAQHFQLSEDELAEMLPSGFARVFDNRIGWAKTHLKGAGLIESPSRAKYCITQRGLDSLANNLGPINIAHLQQFDEYNHFRSGSKAEKSVSGLTTDSSETDEMTPSEQIEFGYQKIRREIEVELIPKIKSASLMIDSGVGVTKVATYEVKRLDSDYFEE